MREEGDELIVGVNRQIKRPVILKKKRKKMLACLYRKSRKKVQKSRSG